MAKTERNISIVVSGRYEAGQAFARAEADVARLRKAEVRDVGQSVHASVGRTERDNAQLAQMREMYRQRERMDQEASAARVREQAQRRVESRADSPDVRDAMARKIRQMRAAAAEERAALARSEAEYQADLRLYGQQRADEIRRQAAQEAAARAVAEEKEGGLKGLVHDMGSARLVKKVLKGGLVGFAGHELAEFTSKLVEIKQHIHEGDKNWAQLTQDILESIPILGGFAKAGADIRELFTGEKQAAKELAAHLETVNHAMAAQKAFAKETLEIHKQMVQVAAELAQRRELAGLAGPERQQRQLQIERENRDRDLRESAKQQKEKSDQESKKQITEKNAEGRTLAEQQAWAGQEAAKARKEYDEAQQALQKTMARYGVKSEQELPRTESEYPARQRDEAEKKLRDFERKRDEAAGRIQATTQGNEDRKNKVDRDLNRQLTESRQTWQEEEAQRAYAQQAAEQEKQAQHQQRLTDIESEGQRQRQDLQSQAREKAMRARGQDQEADVEAMRRSYAEQNAAIGEELRQRQTKIAEAKRAVEQERNRPTPSSVDVALAEGAAKQKKKEAEAAVAQKAPDAGVKKEEADAAEAEAQRQRNLLESHNAAIARGEAEVKQQQENYAKAQDLAAGKKQDLAAAQAADEEAAARKRRDAAEQRERELNEVKAQAQATALRQLGQAFAAELVLTKEAYDRRIAEINKREQDALRARPQDGKQIRQKAQAERDVAAGQATSEQRRAVEEEYSRREGIAHSLASIEQQILQSQGEAGVRGARLEAEKLAIAERYAAQREQINRLLRDEHVREEEKIKARKLLTGLDEAEQRDLKWAGFRGLSSGVAEAHNAGNTRGYAEVSAMMAEQRVYQTAQQRLTQLAEARKGEREMSPAEIHQQAIRNINAAARADLGRALRGEQGGKGGIGAPPPGVMAPLGENDPIEQTKVTNDKLTAMLAQITEMVSWWKQRAPMILEAR